MKYQYFQLQVEGAPKINHPTPGSAASAARTVDPTLDHETIVRELGEHGVFVLPNHHGIRIVRVVQ